MSAEDNSRTGPPWAHVRVYGHDLTNTSGLLYLQALVPIVRRPDVEQIAGLNGLAMESETKGQPSGHVLLETIGDALVVEQLAKALVTAGLKRI